MARKPVFGFCRLCGVHGKLSFEHVPPRRAYNDSPVVLKRGEEMLNRHPDDTRGRTEQRGAGRHTLCERCNNQTGAWYGAEYVRWARQGMEVLAIQGNDPVRCGSFHIRPLPVLKQVICMFFSANSPTFRLRAPELARFVLDRDRRGLDPRFKVYTFLNAGPRMRLMGFSVRGTTRTGEIEILSEVTTRPFGYLLTVEEAAPRVELLDISWFAECPLDEERTLPLPLPVQDVYSQFPGDFRSRDAVLRDAARSEVDVEQSSPPPPEGLLDQVERMDGAYRRWGTEE